jgi:hypothetical protein
MSQQPPRLPALQDSGRQNAERPALPNITSLMLGSMQPTPGPLGIQASGNSAAQPSTIWGNPSQMLARSIALRQAANSSSSSGEVRPVLVPQASAAPVVAPADTEADRPPRDPLLVPDDGHFPMYEAELDPTHLTQAGRQGPGRERRATLSEHHVELDEVCTICLQDAHEGERMCRLICRHMFHYACWTQTVATGPARNQERVDTCPNCQGMGPRDILLERHGHIHCHTVQSSHRSGSSEYVGNVWSRTCEGGTTNSETNTRARSHGQKVGALGAYT